MVINQNYWGSILKQVQIGAIGVFTIVGLVISDWLYRDTQEKLFTDLGHNVSVINQYYKQSFYHREVNLTSIGYRLLDIKGDDQDSLRLSLAKKYLQYNTELKAFGLANINGELTTFTGQKPGEPNINLMDSENSRRSFVQATQSEGLVIGEVYFFEPINEWMMPIRVPLKNRKDELIGVNTSAISYSVLMKTVRDFDLNPAYQLHFVNADHNTTQMYFPLDSTDYGSILGKNASIYTDTLFSKVHDQLTRFRVKNRIEDVEVLGVKTNSGIFNHYLIVSVNKSVLNDLFFTRVQFVFIIYVMLILVVVFGFNFLKKKEYKHIRELLKERKYSDDIIYGSPALIIGIRNSGNCSFVNPATLNTILYNKKEIIGQNWWKKLYPGKYYEQVTQLFEDVKNGEVVDYEMTLVRKDGVERVVSWNSLSFFDKNGATTEIVGFGNDVTELKKAQFELKKYTEDLEVLVKERTEELTGTNNALTASNYQLKEQHQVLKDTLGNLENTQKQLFQADKMASLGILLAGVGHEINNPLNFINGGIQGLKNLENRSEAYASESKPFYDIIEEGVGRAANIVKSLSHFSRKTGKMNEPCDIHLIIDNCLTILHNRLKHKVDVEKILTSEDSIIVGSEGKLHQAILNVLSNAEQAIETKGIISITTQRSKNAFSLSIKDNGAGISKENIAKVGYPFFTTKEVGMGTGLGLSITYSIIEEHKGNIELNSKMGEGTEFILNFPV